MDMFVTLTLGCVLLFYQGLALESTLDCARFSCEYTLIEKLINIQTENTKLAERLAALEKRGNDRWQYLHISDCPTQHPLLVQ
jgi:hypothetical protein